MNIQFRAIFPYIHFARLVYRLHHHYSFRFSSAKNHFFSKFSRPISIPCDILGDVRAFMKLPTHAMLCGLVPFDTSYTQCLPVTGSKPVIHWASYTFAAILSQRHISGFFLTILWPLWRVATICRRNVCSWLHTWTWPSCCHSEVCDQAASRFLSVLSELSR